MTEDRFPQVPRPPDGAHDDLLRRAADAIRASRALAAFVPLTPAEREAMADEVIARMCGGASEEEAPSRASSSREQAAASPGAPPSSATSPSATSPSATLPSEPASSLEASRFATRPMRPRSRSRSVAIVLTSMLALAAAIAIVLRAARHEVDALASYAMTVEGEQPARGGTAPSGPGSAPITLRPETELVVTLVPRQPARDAQLRLVIVRNGRATLLDPSTTAHAGRFVIRGPAAALLGAQGDGPAELVAVLGRELPGDAEVLELAGHAPTGASGHLQVLRQPILLEQFSSGSIDVLLGGCSTVFEPSAALGRPRPRCEVAAGGRVQLWIDVPSATAVELRVDRRVLGAVAMSRGGGTAFVLDMPGHAGLLSIRVADREVAAWDLAPATVFDKLEPAVAAIRAGKLDEADAALDAITGELTPAERVELIRRRAVIAYLRGELEQSLELRRQAIPLARAIGRTSLEMDQGVALLDGLRKQHAFRQAAQLLPALDAHGMIYADGAIRREVAHGLFASELGDLGAALGWFQRAITIAERVDNLAERSLVLAPLADVLSSLGRTGEARALIDAELERSQQVGDPCMRVEALTSAGWLLRDLEPRKAQRLVDQATELATTSCAQRVAIALLNQGWLLAAARRFGEARAILTRIAALKQPPDAIVKTWVLRLEAETLLGEDPARAERYAQRLAAQAAVLCSSELAYEAHLLRARALSSLDRPEQAWTAFAEAEKALTLWSRLVPLGEGRETFFQRHDQLALTMIPFLLSQIRRGDPGARMALAGTARRSIARFVSSLAEGGRARAREQRGVPIRDETSRQFAQTLERWLATVSANDAPASGAAVANVCELRDAASRTESALALTAPPAHAALLVHPIPGSLLVLVWRGASVEIRELSDAEADEPDDELAGRIVSAAAPMLVGAPRIDLYVHRSLARLPLDRHLAAQLETPDLAIAFAVDAHVPAPAIACTGVRRALLVANPQRNLWAASESARTVRGDLSRMGFQVDLLEGPAATRAAIVARLADPCTALFQYDGHGTAAAQRTPGATSRDRIDDTLVLAGGELLAASDVLELARVPSQVVLNGCTTAASEGLGLAQAFLIAGSDQVVASLEAVAADEAAKLTRTLFEAAPSSAAGFDLVRLFTRATLGMRASSFRAFER